MENIDIGNYSKTDYLNKILALKERYIRICDNIRRTIPDTGEQVFSVKRERIVINLFNLLEKKDKLLPIGFYHSVDKHLLQRDPSSPVDNVESLRVVLEFEVNVKSIKYMYIDFYGDKFNVLLSSGIEDIYPYGKGLYSDFNEIEDFLKYMPDLNMKIQVVGDGNIKCQI